MPQQHPIYHSQTEQRAARQKLYQQKPKFTASELNKKEKILHIMEAADAVSQGQKAPEAPHHMQHPEYSPQQNVKSTKSPKSSAAAKSAATTSLFMSDPSSKEALAAEQRIQQKQSKKMKNAEARKDRTRELLFGDGLNESGPDAEPKKSSPKSGAKSSSIYKSDRSVPVNSSTAASAALARLSVQKNAKMTNSKDRKQRTMDLVHGDLLRSDDEVKAAPRTSTYDDDIDPDIAEVHQSVLNLNNCNDHFQMPATAKLLRKVITNILSAETVGDQEKYGKLRLTNKKIRAAFVEMEYGVETLQSLGFERKSVFNEKDGKMDDYMVFNFQRQNTKALLHVLDLLNEYYPEV